MQRVRALTAALTHVRGARSTSWRMISPSRAARRPSASCRRSWRGWRHDCAWGARAHALSCARPLSALRRPAAGRGAAHRERLLQHAQPAQPVGGGGEQRARAHAAPGRGGARPREDDQRHAGDAARRGHRRRHHLQVPVRADGGPGVHRAPHAGAAPQHAQELCCDPLRARPAPPHAAEPLRAARGAGLHPRARAVRVAHGRDPAQPANAAGRGPQRPVLLPGDHLLRRPALPAPPGQRARQHRAAAHAGDARPVPVLLLDGGRPRRQPVRHGRVHARRGGARALHGVHALLQGD
jgi:hypothetical protein